MMKSTSALYLPLCRGNLSRAVVFSVIYDCSQYVVNNLIISVHNYSCKNATFFISHLN